MYTSFQLATKYLRYYATAKNRKGHGMHSPFVFEFILDVLNNRQQFQASAAISALHQQLKKDDQVLMVEDLGAGSRTGAMKQRTVGQLAKTAVKPQKYSRLLFRLAKKYQPAVVVELGTSLGITTSYLSNALPGATIYTIEGSTAILRKAEENFETLGLKNVQSKHGNFDDLLPELLEKLPAVDLAYIDGNHRYTPTMAYFQEFLAKMHNESIMVFDDIHWSAEMEKAWSEIKGHPSVRCTIDIFFLGFVFFRKEFKEPQHLCIRY